MSSNHVAQPNGSTDGIHPSGAEPDVQLAAQPNDDAATAAGVEVPAAPTGITPEKLPLPDGGAPVKAEPDGPGELGSPLSPEELSALAEVGLGHIALTPAQVEDCKVRIGMEAAIFGAVGTTGGS